MVVSVDTTLTDATTDEITADLREARNDPDIEAVVLQVNSPGGSVTASEGLFFAVERTAEEMPVIAQVQSTAASGGYYMIAPADEIYVSPGSIVGSVGVRATYADSPSVDGEITTGPDKNGGFTEDEITRQVDSMQDTFIDSVTTHRGDKLALSETELANAKVYVGTQSVNNGLADSIGDRDIAIDRAATEAGLDNYRIEKRSHTVTGALGLLGGANETKTDGVTVETPTYLALYGSIADYQAEGSASPDHVAGNNQTAVADGGESNGR
ncbi:S49 family peptidase [Halalkalirubrum salinum]|uniref:S49 family peptidase n=1 Tax=Halalkalirubrum salinum TaxID=2563889 RepID=UPI00197ACD87|nr:S49 family peptidase [Halalkalirubrum salinum]